MLYEFLKYNMHIQSTLVISKSKGPVENTSRYPYFDISDVQN